METRKLIMQPKFELKKQEIFVSFILPAYKARFLKQAIDSILSQSYSQFELVIVDDASPEDLQGIVIAYDDPRISYYRNDKNIGGKSLVSQWNYSILFAKGEYLVLAADDDVYHPDFLKNCVGLAAKYPEVNLIRSRVEKIDEYNHMIGLDGLLPEYCSKYQYLHYWLAATAFTCIGNYLFKSSVIKQKQFIDFPSAFCSDVASVIMMAENGIVNTTEMLFSFRISSIHLSSNKAKLTEKLSANTLLYRWLSNLDYEKPENRYDNFSYEQTRWASLYLKCKYDYYNQVIKYLPFYKFTQIDKCELLSGKDKVILFFRFFFDKIFRRI